MAGRTRAQQIGSEGQRLVEYVIASSKAWIARAQDEDYGVDLEAELAIPNVSGQLLKIQIKASERVPINKRGVSFVLDHALVAYADVCRVPIIHVRVDLRRERAWYLWLQRWLLEQRRRGIGLTELPNRISVGVPESNTLESGLKGELQEIARWSTNEQLVLVLNDVIRTAASLYRNDVLLPMLDLLSKLDALTEEFPVDLVIDQAVSLGPSLWGTVGGNQASSALYSVCRALGYRFSAEQIWKMVVRDESYSRTGINALGILYDEHPKHVGSLGLAALFESHADLRVAYYCKLRELHLGEPCIKIFSKASGLRIGKLMASPSIEDNFMNKWANRGDSALLDYLVEVE